ncbi:helix-turn-helix domain-containing protein [Streptomyces rubiginosohelvolus]|uniref:helix-turn-helix domain-containing protein n=1 Tax=Streptomyces rubiginosohelvolus TaxID=67362 RepID=UPI0036DDF917
MPFPDSDSFGSRSSSSDLLVADIEYVIERGPNPDWRIRDFINQRSAILAYCVSGRAHYSVDDKAYEIRAGDVLFMPKAAPHTASSDPGNPWRFISVAFTLTDLALADVPDPSVVPVTTSNMQGDVARSFHEMFTAWSAKPPGYLLQIRGNVALTLGRIISASDGLENAPPYQRRIAAITTLLAENFDTTYSIEELAERANLSTSHFRAIFKRATGMTATQYQQHLKIARATEFLASGEYSVSEAARASGFRYVGYFSYLYKKLTGVNPSTITRS